MIKKPAVGNKKSTTVIADPDDRKGMLKSVGGSQSDNWNNLGMPSSMGAIRRRRL